MNKEEASSFLKELLTDCKLNKNSFVLLEPDSKNTQSTGYKIRINAVLTNECRQQVRQLTKKHDLAVIEEEAQIIVYKPPQTMRVQ